MATDDSRFVVTYGNGDGCIYLYDCTLPTVVFHLLSNIDVLYDFVIIDQSVNSPMLCRDYTVY